jgi:hypothetical protein
LKNEKVKDSVRTGVWAECARTSSFLSNVMLIKAKDECPHQLMFGSKPKLPTSFFGEKGVITIKDYI